MRGKILEIANDGKGGKFECNVFLIDKGYYFNVKKKDHIIAINGVLAHDPQFELVILDGVLPNPTM